MRGLSSSIGSAVVRWLDDGRALAREVVRADQTLHSDEEVLDDGIGFLLSGPDEGRAGSVRSSAVTWRLRLPGLTVLSYELARLRGQQ